jgi:hypothetical protein
MNIELTQEQVAAFNRGESITITPKPNQWKPSGGSHRSTIKVGRNSALALVEAEEMLYFYDKLLKYVNEFGGNWVADWNDDSQYKFFILWDNSIGDWSYGQVSKACVAGAVYMSQQCAKGLIAKLKSGEVVL